MAFEEFKPQLDPTPYPQLKDALARLKPKATNFRGEIDTLVQLIEGIEFDRFSSPYQLRDQGEMEYDLYTVKGLLRSQKFSTTLIESIDEIEDQYKVAESEFEFRDTIGRIRSFLEHLHREACKQITGQDIRWGAATTELKRSDVISDALEKYVTSLYRVISDLGVHTLVSRREYSRIFKNAVFEYALLLLSLLNKK